MTPKTLPRRDASPVAGAENSTMPTPMNATRAKASAPGLMYSSKNLAPIGTMRNGVIAPINSALATLL